MSGTESRSPERWRRASEIAGVFLLSVVAVLTAWCGFQASKWGGEMSIAFSQASSARIQAALLTVLFALVLFLTAMSQRELAPGSDARCSASRSWSP